MTILIFIFVVLLVELIYFRIADRFNIIDKPNERSSHSSVVLRGGGVIFTVGLWLWAILASCGVLDGGESVTIYPLMLLGVSAAAIVSFVDDIHSLPDSVRLVVQFAAMGLIVWQLVDGADVEAVGLLDFGSSIWLKWLFVLVALVVCVGATNVYNFMDGINGITAGYSIAVLLPLMLVNQGSGFVENSLLLVILLSLLVFSIFNFRPKGKAKCFAGDVGSISIALILLFIIGRLIVKTGDVTWLIFLLVYGVDGCMTICHRIMLHENLGEAHRKHAYQLMANELKLSHMLVSAIYMAMQLVISLGFIYLCPNTVLAHWIYLLCALVLLALGYILFMKKYYHLHEAYLAGLRK